jgi:signal transduction histidine kinase/CheY-like chemotaxis protein
VSDVPTGSGGDTEARLRRANRALRLLTECNAAVIHATDEMALLSEVCRIAVESAGYFVAWIGRAEHDAEKTVSVVTMAGPGQFLFDLKVTWADDDPRGQGVLGTAIRTRRAFIIRDLAHDSRFGVWRKSVEEEGLGSAIGVPLVVDNQVYGALAIYAKDSAAFEEAEVGLLEDMGANIAHGMAGLRVQRERDASSRIAADLLEHLRRAQKVAQIGTWEMDPVTRKTRGSEESFAIYGMTPTADWSIPIDELKACALAEYRPLLEQRLSDFFAGRETYDVEFAIRRPSDGEIRFVHNRAELLREPDGRASLAVGTIQDITGRRQLEQQLLQAQKMESVGRLAGGVAHDFNNLLTVIHSYTNILMKSVGQEHPFYGDLREIQRAAHRAGELTRQLLAFSRKQVLQPRVMDLNQVVEAADRMLRRLIGEDIELVCIPGAGLGKVFADPGQIEQVLMNLAVNARDAMAHGGRLTIETSNIQLTADYAAVHRDVRPGPYVMLAVTDSGEGMDAETRSHIFEPFFTTKKERGTGLGLSTVYGIVRQSEGHIWVYSEVGRGSTFKVYLPFATGEESMSTPPPIEQLGGRAIETILVVEDDEQVRTVICRTLERAGYTVLSAADPPTAMSVARQYQGSLHLLLTDVVLPGITGPVLARELSALSPTTKIMFMSGYTDNAIVHQGLLERDVAFLQKPFTPQALAAKIREVLDEK